MKIHTDEELVFDAFHSANLEYSKHVKSIPEQIKRLYQELNEIPELVEVANTLDNSSQNTDIENKKNAIKYKISNLSVQTLLIQNRIRNLQNILMFITSKNPFDYFEVGYTFNESDIDTVNNLHMYPIVNITDPKAAVVFRDIFGQQVVQVNTEFRVPLEAIDSNAEFLIDNNLLPFKDFLKIKREAIQQRKDTFWYRTSKYEKMTLEESMARADKELEVVNSLTEEEYINLVSTLYFDLMRVLTILI